MKSVTMLVLCVLLQTHPQVQAPSGAVTLAEVQLASGVIATRSHLPVEASILPTDGEQNGTFSIWAGCELEEHPEPLAIIARKYTDEGSVVHELRTVDSESLKAQYDVGQVAAALITISARIFLDRDPENRGLSFRVTRYGPDYSVIISKRPLSFNTMTVTFSRKLKVKGVDIGHHGP